MPAVVRPRYAEESGTLADLAAHLLAERIAKYPAIVARAKMTQAEADTAIRAMRGVADLWRAIVDHAPAPTGCPCCGGASPREQRDTIATAAARTAQIAAAAPGDKDKADYAAATAALLWHAEHRLAAHLHCRGTHAQAA
jgi:hypothetical protein